jgi:hypothetical protein
MYHVPSNAWGQTLAGYDLQQHIALESAMLAIVRHQHMSDLGFEWSRQGLQLVTWSPLQEVYDFEQ